MTSATHPPQFHPHDHRGQVKFASGINLLDGLYLLISGAIGAANAGNRINSIVFGIIVAILAGSRLGGSKPWASWLAALIGVWMIISPWVYGYAGEAWTETNSIIVGIIMIVFGAWSALASQSEQPTTGGL